MLTVVGAKSHRFRWCSMSDRLMHSECRGHQASAFDAIIDAGTTTATACAVSLSAGPAGSFVYQTTDANNQLTGGPNAPADIPATQHYVFGYTPSVTLNSLELGIVFECRNAPIVSIPGVNTFILSASSTQTPDV